MERHEIPLRERPADVALLAFFWLNLLVITYMVDLEQLVIADPAHFTYPRWPPAFMIDLVHWWGRTYDPLLLARPVWWQMTIWIDVLFFGPFYAVGIHAFTAGKEWIRLPSVVWAAVMLTNVTIILGEEVAGPHRSRALGMVLAANASWVLVPLAVLYRMRAEQPFTRA